MSDDTETPGPGHNSMGAAGDRLRKFVDRIENLEEEKSTLTVDIREVYTEVKAAGFDTKIVRQAVRRRKMDRAARDEMDEVLSIYERALEDVIG